MVKPVCAKRKIRICSFIHSWQLIFIQIMYIIASPVGDIWFVKPYFFLGIDPWAWRVETINKKPPIRTPSGPVAFWLDEEEARLSVTNVREEMAHVTLELGKQVGWYHGINKALFFYLACPHVSKSTSGEMGCTSGGQLSWANATGGSFQEESEAFFLL